MYGKGTDIQVICTLVFLLQTAVSAAADADCPTTDGWYRHGQTCYYISPAAGPVYVFDDAANLCSELNTTVTSIRNLEESNFIANKIASVDYWIGLVTVAGYDDNELDLEKRREGWRWLDDTEYNYTDPGSTWTRWSQGEPKEEKHCAYVHYGNDTWLWNGAGCDYDSFPVICGKALVIDGTNTNTTSDGVPLAGIIGGVCSAVVVTLCGIGLFLFIRRRSKQQKKQKAEPPECPYVDFARTSPGVTRPPGASTENIVEQIVAMNNKNQKKLSKNSTREPSYYNVKRIGSEQQPQSSNLYIVDMDSAPTQDSRPYFMRGFDHSNPDLIAPYAVGGSALQADRDGSRRVGESPYDNAGFVNGRPGGQEEGVTVLYAKPNKERRKNNRTSEI